MMLTALLLVAVALGAEPLQGWVPGGKDILPDTPVSECASPSVSPDVEFSPVLDNYTAGATLTFSCHNASWTLIGQSVIVCQNDGQWSSSFPLCKYVICEELISSGLNSHAKVGITYDKSDYPLLPGTVAVHSCDANYELDGNDKRTCTGNGSWTGLPPKCIGKCLPMTAPHNSSVMYSPRGCQHENCTATIKCDRGFNKVDDRKYTCNRTGTWVPEPITKCSRIYCEDPIDPPDFGKVDIHPPNKDGKYEYGIMLVYTCNAGHSLVGKNVITCSGFGTWSGNVPKCIETPESTPVVSTEGTTSDNATTTTQASKSPACPSPEMPSNGEYRIKDNMVMYNCHHGYRLEGSLERTCLVNQSWSGNIPKCVLLERSTPRPFLWKQIFVDNKMWEGSYIFKGNPHHFKMWVTSINIHPDGDIGALLVDEASKFNVKGYHSSDAIVFQISQVLKPSDRFPDTKWYVSGNLQKIDHNWAYTGKIWSETPGFKTLTMKPSKNVPKAMPGHDASPNMTALALGITIAAVSIIIAAVLAAFCVKRKVSFGSGGHRTLTSFENPVYEYENSLKDPGA